MGFFREKLSRVKELLRGKFRYFSHVEMLLSNVFFLNFKYCTSCDLLFFHVVLNVDFHLQKTIRANLLTPNPTPTRKDCFNLPFVEEEPSYVQFLMACTPMDS